MMSTYTQSEFTKLMDTSSIHTILECGSRDCLDAIEMNEFYKPKIIYAFECNPDSVLVCERNSKNYSKVRMIPFAVTNTDTPVPFYATDMEKSVDKNIGASSLLQHFENNLNGYVQKQVSVMGIRLDTFMKAFKLDVVDLLCFDLQGAEYLAIEGLGDRIKDVRYIISEVSKKHYYHGDMLFPAFNMLLMNKGFELLAQQKGDALYKNKNI